MTSSRLAPAPCQWFSRLAGPLDRRSAPRLALLFLGAILARGRRTVTSWIRAVRLSDQFRSCCIAVAAAGKESDIIAAYLIRVAVKPLVSGAGRLTFALDDTPTKRYGPHVQGAGVHHNPTPWPTNIWRFLRGTAARAAIGSTDSRRRPLSGPRTRAAAWPRRPRR